MGAAQEIILNIQELAQNIDTKWQGRVELRDIDGTHVLAEPDKAVIGVACDKQPTQLLEMALNQGLKQMCQLSSLQLERELNTSASMLVDPMSFIKHPLATIMNPLDVSQAKEDELRKYQFRFSKARQKNEVLQSLVDYLSQHVKAESLIQDVRGIADELFTNAIYNAPFAGSDSHPSMAKDRTDMSIEMPSGFEGQLFAGIRENQIVIGCHDPFGTLRVKSLLKRILLCYQQGVADTMVMEGKGGAGIGSYMVYNSSASYYVGIVKNQATVVCCSLPTNMSSRKRGQIAKNMHFFEIHGGQ